MRSVFYIEEDFVAGLLKNFFQGNRKSTHFLRSGSNGHLAEELLHDDVDIFITQSEDPERLSKILTTVMESSHRVPTLVITSIADRIPEQCKAFAHCVSMQELLESSLRWHIRLAKTMRRFQEVRALFEDAESVLILLQDDPDPDAIASGLALRQVLGRNKQTTPLGSFGRVTRPENMAMVRLLEIDIEKLTLESLAKFDRIAVVDLQPPHLSVAPENIDLVIDHHPEQFTYKSTIRDIRPGYGATSTILLEYLLCAQASIGTRLATAMLYGIKSDTFLLSREVNEWDVQAFSYLYPLANQNQMRRIERPELPPAALDALSVALRDRIVIDKVAFIHLGRVERDDLIPQMADFSLSFEGIEWAFVSGVFEGNYIVSVRNVGYVRAAGRVLKDAFADVGSAGGHASMAKAVIPISNITEKWGIDARSIQRMNRRTQLEFLRSLRHTR